MYITLIKENNEESHKLFYSLRYMKSKGLFCLVFFIFLLLLPAPLMAREDLFIAHLAETLLYSQEGISMGGGFALGFGSGSAIGIRLLYALDADTYGILEMLFFLRFYLSASNASSGPFLQFNGGPVLFTNEGIGSTREGVGTLSAGISGGWRFLLGNHWFVEPAIRAGYPYITGAGVSAGLRL